MLYFFSGTDREKVRQNANALLTHKAKGADIVSITDANTVTDLRAALQGGGMFGNKRAIVFQDAFANEEMRALLIDELSRLKDSEEVFFVLEEKVDAATRKQIEKYAEKSERFDAKKGTEKRGNVFEMAFALSRADKKALWVGYMRALARGEAPEAIHGVLFWGAKDMVLKKNDARGARLVASLAELPHASRRKAFDLEYALETFILNCE